MNEVLPDKSLGQAVKSKIKILDQYISKNFADIYETAVDLFPRYETLKTIGINISPDETVCHYLSNINTIFLPMNPGVLANVTVRRALSRLGIDQEITDENREIAQMLTHLFAFSHELGHAVQYDTEFAQDFGELESKHHGFNPKTATQEELAQYRNAENEKNADYIAALLIAQSRFGTEFGFEFPAESPRDWREWDSKHPV
jgi:hypothetical protein